MGARAPPRTLSQAVSRRMAKDLDGPNTPKATTVRVLFVNTNPAWGGGENWHTINLAQLADRGHQVAALVHPGGALQRQLAQALPSIDVFLAQHGNLSWLDPRARRTARRLIQTWQPEAVLVSLPNDAKIILPAAKKLGVPKRIYRRGLATAIRNTWLNRDLFRHAATDIIVNSLDTKAAVLKNNPELVPEHKIHLVYNGVPDDPRPLVDVTAAHDQRPPPLALAHKGSGLRIFHAGRLTPQKGQDFLLDVCAELRRKGHAFQCVIAGTGELQSHLEQRRAALNLEQQVHFVGFQGDLVPWFDWCDVFVMPSRFEGFGFVAVEAMLRARPVVAADASSLRELVVHKATGRRVPFGDTEGFAAAVLDCGDGQVAQAYGLAGRHRALQNFSLKRATDQLEAILSGGSRA